MTTIEFIVVLLHNLRCFFSIYSSPKYSINFLAIQDSIKNGVASAIPSDLLTLIASTSRRKRKGTQNVVNTSIPWIIDGDIRYKVYFKIFSQINESIFKIGATSLHNLERKIILLEYGQPFSKSTQGMRRLQNLLSYSIV